MFNLTFHKQGYENIYSGDTDECPKPRIKLIRGDTVEYIPTTTELAGKPEMAIVDGLAWHYLLQSYPFPLGEGRWNVKDVTEAIDSLQPCGDDGFTFRNPVGSVGGSYFTHNAHSVTNPADDLIYGAVCSRPEWYYVNTTNRTVTAMSGYVSSATDSHTSITIIKQGLATLNQYGKPIQCAKNGEIVKTFPALAMNAHFSTGLDLVDYLNVRQGESYIYDVTADTMTATTNIFEGYKVIVDYPRVYFVNGNSEVYRYTKSGLSRMSELDSLLSYNSSYFLLSKRVFLKVTGNTLSVIDFKLRTETIIYEATDLYALNILYAPNGYVYLQSTFNGPQQLYSINKNTFEVKKYITSTGVNTNMNYNLGANGRAYCFPRSGTTVVNEIIFNNTEQFNPLLMSNILYRNC